MGKKQSTKPIDIAKEGPLNWRSLQQQNGYMYDTPESLGLPSVGEFTPMPTWAYTYEGEEQSPLMQQTTRLGNRDYLGNSIWDPQEVSTDQLENLSDIRAENQPWYSKLVNGIAKAGVLAATTALETLGLLYGVGQGIYDAANAEDGNGGKAFLHGLWDNPITNALQSVNEASEDLMPNYYTQDEMENPWHHIFNANWIGDKLLKNVGFMVGAFYGGIPASKALGAFGVKSAKAARAAASAERAGMAKRVGELTAEYADDVVGLERALAQEGLTEAERGKRILEGFDKIRDVARTTRATTQTVGSLGSAINEGAIEALNNSKDWAKQQTKIASDEYQQLLADIEQAYGDTEMETALKMKAAEDYQKKLAEIEEGRARMGNADLLLNIPILMASNMYELGKLYSRGFDSTRRQMGSFLSGRKLAGSLKNGTLASDKTWKKGLLTSLAKSNTEGLEEYLQRAASDGAGQAVTDSINRFMEAGTGEEATNDVNDFIAGFGKAIADNLGDPNAWEEYFIGAVSAAFGMPVFGSQTKNAYIGKNAPVGLAGGLVGNYQDYMADKAHEEQVAQYLNQRVKDPKFKALYDNLKKQDDYDKWLQEELEKGDKSLYKDLELEKFYQDLNAAASAGHLEEFKQMVGYNTEYSDEELEDIVKQTTREITPEQQRKADEDRKNYLEGAIQTALGNNEDSLVEDYSKELEEVNKRLEEDNYQSKLDGPFIDRNGQMNVTNPEKMKAILERNRQNLLEGIDDYLKIRNDIDIETDGNLDDTQIALLTQMKGKILDYEKRSAEIAEDLVYHLGGVLVDQEYWRDKITGDLEKAQREYNETKNHLEAAKKGKQSKEHLQKLEEDFVKKEKRLNKAKAANNSVSNVIKLLEMLTEQKDMTSGEAAAFHKGYGDSFWTRLGKRTLGWTRNINSDEAQAILANPQNVMTLLSIVNSKTSELDESTRQRLTQEIVDLSTLANQKIAYNKKVREYMGDPSLINDAYRQAQDNISQKEKDTKSDELAFNIKGARNMSELDNIMKQAYQVNPDIAQAALQKAKQTADDNTKKFLDDYEKGTKFFGDFSQQAQKLPEEVMAGVMGTAVSAWEEALANGVDLYDRFTQNLNDAVADLNAEGTPASKATADGLKQVLKDLDAAKRSTATNKKAKKTTTTKKSDNIEENSDEDAGGLGALAKLRNKGKEKKEEPETPIDSEEEILKAVAQEIRDSKQKDGTYKVDNLNKLSRPLQDRIEKYNDANPESAIIIDMAEMLQTIADEDIVDDSLDEKDFKSDGTDLGEDNDGSDRADRMQENLRVSFKSDHPTEFRFNVDYRIPYDPEDKVLKAVQELLKQLKAYQFVDKNYLGYVAREFAKKDEKPEIYFLRSTDDIINSDPANPITFLAIKWDDKAEKAVRKYGFNGRNDINLSEEVKPVTINGEQYQIIGVMTINAQIDENVSKAFASLQGSLNEELNPQVEQAKQNGEQFVISSKTTQTDSINTGRLEKRNDENDPENKVSLYDFMTDQQGNPERRTSTEWDSGMDFYFGVVVNGYLNATEDESVRGMVEEPNDVWMEKNNGAIVMFIPKPDGRLYPIRCTRRTVKEWLESNDLDGQHNGQQMLEAVMSGAVQNQYLGNILNYLKTIYNSESTVGDKMNAKVMLSKYFIFGKQSPLHFNGNEITLTFNGKEYDLTKDTFEEFAQAFFDTLSDENIMFTLPTQSIEDINGRDVVTAGILEVGLRNFYNFNANFTIYPIDGDGNTVVPESAPEEGQHFTGGDNVRATQVEFDLGDGMKTYTIEGDGTVTLEGKQVDANTQNLVKLAKQAEQGTLPQFKFEFWDKSKRSIDPNIKKFTLDGITGFDNVYIIHAEEDWVYDGRKGNHDVRLYKLSSDEGTKLKKDFNQAILDFNMKPVNMEALKKLKKAEKTASSGGETVTSGFSIGDVVLIPATTSDRTSSDIAKLIKDGKIEAIVTGVHDDGYIDVQYGNVSGSVKADKVTKKPVASTITVSSIPSSPQTGKQFAGKTLDELDSKEGGLQEVLVANKKSPAVSKYIYPTLQAAEEAGLPIDHQKVADSIKDILAAKGEEKKKLLDNLLNEIKGCNRR